MKERKEKIDELLSCYIDGELGRREHMEVQRLIQNDPDIAEQLAKMRKHKLLVNSMPMDSAPALLYDDVRAALERQSILDSHSHTASEKAGKRHLFLRRFANAAIVLIMLGSLVAIIAGIVMPISDSENLAAGDFGTSEQRLPISATPQSNPSMHISAEPMQAQAPPPPTQPFIARLDLHTSNPIGMDNFIKKQVFNHDLLDTTMPTRSDDASTYKITAGLDQARSFVADLGQAWSQTDAASLTLSDSRFSESDIHIELSSAEQIHQLLQQTDPARRIEIARTLSSGETNHMLADTGDQQGDEVVLPDPGRPELASGVRRQIAAKTNSEAEQVIVIVTIHSD